MPNRTNNATKSIPRLPELPLIGSLLPALTNDTQFRQNLRRLYPDICRFHMGPATAVLVARADLCQEVLLNTEDFDKTPAVTASARPAFGSGILLIENDPHRARRRIIQPAFNHSQVIRYADTISASALRQGTLWEDGQVIDIGQAMTALTLRIIGKIMFDLDDLGDENELGHAITTVFEYMKTGFLFPVPLSWPLPHNIRMKHALTLLDSMIYNTINTVRNETRIDDAESGDSTSKQSNLRASRLDKVDLLSLLLAARDQDGRRLTDKEIRDDAMAILVAGHETVAHTLAFAFYLLSKHPTAYARLHHEVETVLAGRAPMVEDISQLPFTTQVFKETLRLFPAAHTLPRQVTRDTTIGDYQVRRNWFVGVDVWGMHRRPDYFPNPNRFDPDRFTQEREALIPRNAYIPFGSGPRNCIGRGLAMIEGPLILAALAQQVHLELEPDAKLKLKFLLTLRPKNPLMMRVRRL